MRRVLPLALLLALLIPAAAQAQELSASTARTETAYYAQTVLERGSAIRFRVHSCRRHSARAVSCSFRVYGPRGYRCGGRVRTALLSRTSYETFSRTLADRCR